MEQLPYSTLVPGEVAHRYKGKLGLYSCVIKSQFIQLVTVLYSKGYQMIELFILLQLMQVLTPGSNLINFNEDQKEIEVRTSISHK